MRPIGTRCHTRYEEHRVSEQLRYLTVNWSTRVREPLANKCIHQSSFIKFTVRIENLHRVTELHLDLQSRVEFSPNRDIIEYFWNCIPSDKKFSQLFNGMKFHFQNFGQKMLRSKNCIFDRKASDWRGEGGAVHMLGYWVCSLFLLPQDLYFTVRDGGASENAAKLP